MKKIASWLLILLAFVPLVVTDTLVPSVGGKVLLYRGAAFAVLALIALILLSRQKKDTLAERFSALRRTPLFIVMSVSTVLLAISTLGAYNPSMAFFGGPNRGEGFLTLFAMYVLYVAMALLFQKKEWKRFFIATALTCLAIFVYQSVQVSEVVERPSATFGNPIFLACYYLFSFLAGYYLCFEKSIKRDAFLVFLGGATMLASIVGIFFSETRGTIIAMVGGMIVASIVAVIAGKNTYAGRVSVRTLGIVFLGLVLTVGVFFATTYKQSFWQSVPGVNRIVDGNIDTLNSRMVFLNITKEGFTHSTTQQKLIGWGWDNISFFANKYYDPKLYAFDQTGIDRLHNKFADTLIMTGILGLVAFITVWTLLIERVRARIKKDAVVGIGLVFVLTSYFIHNLFAFDVPVTFFYFYALLAMLTMNEYEEKQ